jgi:hypothetical protein
MNPIESAARPSHASSFSDRPWEELLDLERSRVELPLGARVSVESGIGDISNGDFEGRAGLSGMAAFRRWKFTVNLCAHSTELRLSPTKRP